ncbi:hypothetical protein N431DRAFT_452967 [Stipitochalara longipes BDJ]|nr:hypothetical protein N431DRAFT_452967 [Stipitochalara longipes BDJ]
MSQNTVTVIVTVPKLLSRFVVGPPKREHKFVIHKEFICYHSSFFSATFNGDFEEGKTQTMKLDGIDPHAFGLLVDWLYTQEFTKTIKKKAEFGHMRRAVDPG